MPVCGKYPKRAEGDAVRSLARLADMLARRCIVRDHELNGLPPRVRARLAHRVYTRDDF